MNVLVIHMYVFNIRVIDKPLIKNRSAIVIKEDENKQKFLLRNS